MHKGTEGLYNFRDSRNLHTVIVDRDTREVRVQTFHEYEARLSHRNIDRDTAAALLWAKRRNAWRPA